MGMILSFAAMAVGLIGLIVCAKKQQNNPALQPVAFACLFVVVAGLGWIVYERLFYDKAGAMMEKETQFQVAVANKVGEIIKGKSLTKIVYIANAGWDKDEQTKKKVEAVKKALETASGATVTIIAPPAPKEDEAMEDINFEQFNTLTKTITNSAIVVESSLPMTENVMPQGAKKAVEKNPQEKLDIFKAENKNFVILLNGEPESRPGMKKLVDEERLIWIAMKPTPRPKKKGEKIKPVEPTGDLKKDFDARYEVFGKDKSAEFFKDMNKK